jgi:hypothetical protein
LVTLKCALAESYRALGEVQDNARAKSGRKKDQQPGSSLVAPHHMEYSSSNEESNQNGNEERCHSNPRQPSANILMLRRPI